MEFKYFDSGMKENFSRNYATLRALITSSIFSLLMYDKSDMKCVKSKHLKKIEFELDDIYTSSPLFLENGFYHPICEEFKHLYTANVLISLLKNLDDIIYIKFNNNMKSVSQYPIREVEKIMVIVSEFIEASNQHGFTEYYYQSNHKIHKLLLLMHHYRIHGIKTAMIRAMNAKNTGFTSIIEYAYMMVVNRYLPNKSTIYMKSNPKKAVRQLGKDILAYNPMMYTDLFTAFLKAHPITIPMYKNDKYYQMGITAIEFVKFILSDEDTTDYINNRLYR